MSISVLPQVEVPAVDQELPVEVVKSAEELEEEAEWYKRAVFYEVFVRSFADGNGDGVGDMIGLRKNLRHIADLGVDAVWLLPIMSSPLRDHGYDVADYRQIHEDYGKMEDFQAFVADAHTLGLKVVVEIVPNHTSSDNMWFQASRNPAHPEHKKYRDWYVWSDSDQVYSDARIIFCDTEKSNWTWDEVRGQFFFHRFFSHQPDLNYDCPAVQQEMLNVVDYWADLGVDGFRVDAPPYLFKREGTNCENLPQTHQYFQKMRAFLDAKMAALGRPRLFLLAEANMLPRDVINYFGNGEDEFSMNFHFPLMPRIFESLAKGDSSPVRSIMAATPELPIPAAKEGQKQRRHSQCQWGTFLRNHDELTLEMVTDEERQFMWETYSPEAKQRLNMGIRRRLAPLLGNDKQLIELAHSLLFTSIGSPFMYAGDEIGMGDNVDLPDRNGCRTPIQWDDSENAGFSEAEESKVFLPVISTGDHSFDKVNVAAQNANPESLLNWIKSTLRVRREHSELFGNGSLRFLTDNVPAHALAYVRSTEGISEKAETAVLVHNISATEPLKMSVPISSVVSDAEAMIATDMLTSKAVKVDAQSIEIDLAPHEFMWISASAIAASSQ